MFIEPGRRARPPPAQHRGRRHGQQPMASDDGALAARLQRRGVQPPDADGASCRRRACSYQHALRHRDRAARCTSGAARRRPSSCAGCSRSRSGTRARASCSLARDRFGVKPLYYALLDDGSLFFGSEIKAHPRERAWCARRCDEDALPDYLANHAPSGDEHAVRGHQAPAAGHTLVWRDGADPHRGATGTCGSRPKPRTRAPTRS